MLCAVLSDETQNRLLKLTKVFLEENQKLNLSAFRTEENCWIGNVLDSLAYLDLELGEEREILDVGTGGGFPLLALALCKPDSHFTGLDSTQKKIDAIKRIAEKMELTNISLVCGRTEELGHDEAMREQFDVVTARAVAPLNTLVEYCAPFAKVHGNLVFWKSLNLEQELHNSLMARAELSCQLQDQHEYELPGDWGKRQLLVLEKRFATKKTYPREIGIPSKHPLL